MTDQIRTWSPRQWEVARKAWLAALVLMGAVGQTLPIASSGRVVPLEWWNYVTLAISPVLIGLIAATFVPTAQPKRAQVRDKTGTAVGGAIGAVAMACPACSPLAIPLFGAGGVLSFLAPERGLIALLSILLLAVTLLLRLRTNRTCSLATIERVPRRLRSR